MSWIPLTACILAILSSITWFHGLQSNMFLYVLHVFERHVTPEFSITQCNCYCFSTVSINMLLFYQTICSIWLHTYGEKLRASFIHAQSFRLLLKISVEKANFHPFDHYLDEVGWLACSSDLEGCADWSYVSW